MMSERKFTRSLCKPGSAAQVRETVCQAVRESTLFDRPHFSEPIDFEAFTLKNRTILQNDPLRELVLFPQDDVSEICISRYYRTVGSTVPTIEGTGNTLFTRMCVRSYIQNWYLVDFKYKAYSGSYLHLPRFPKTSELENQVYEVDTDGENEKLTIGFPCDQQQHEIIKEGFIMKGSESESDSFISLATKAFKRRYVSLRKEVDGVHVMEFYKDAHKTDSKGSLYMDFCCGVVRNSRRGRFCFELHMSEGRKRCVLSAENEEELEAWMKTLSNVISSCRDSTENRYVPCCITYGTLKGLEHSKNPELAKYARETDYSIAQARKENRQNLFAVYPNMQKSTYSCGFYDNETNVKPYKDEFGVRIFVRCEEVKFRLQARLDYEKETLCQVEPYITSLAIFDIRQGKKVSEEFRFDVNHPYIRNMLPYMSNKGNIADTCLAVGGNGLQSGAVSFPFDFKELGEEWISFPKQAIFTVHHPDPDLYFVLRIEKVLQGGISQACEPYLRHQSPSGNGRLGMKVQKAVKSYCQHLGHYRMPFAWAARPVFKSLSGELDTTTEFGPIYRQESTKLSDEDIIHFLSDLKKPEKLKHLTIIPGIIKIFVELVQEMPKNCLTPSLVPLIPFPVPPACEPTLEIEQFPSEVASNCSPFTTYVNHLYVYPKSLKYDGQKFFPKARNIACTVEFRDSDEETAKPLQLIYGRPGETVYATEASTSVTHHNLNPDFYEEVKILLPVRLHEKHHLLFTFRHISCELPKGAKRKDFLMSAVVGYSWFPLLNKERINVEDQILPVSVSLPAGYLSSKPLGLGKGFSGPEIRWVDAGKELFRVSFRLVSTVHTKDQHLHNFFYHWERFIESHSLTVDVEDDVYLSAGTEVVKEVSKCIKALHAVDLSTVIHFLPTLLNELFRLIAAVPEIEVQVNALKVVIHIVHGVHDVGKHDTLRTYVQYVFRTSELSVRSRMVHEELMKCLTAVLEPTNSDFLVTNKFLRHSWFFLQIVSKSMIQHLLSTERIKMLRSERFPVGFNCCVQKFAEHFAPHILQKYKELPIETKHANISYASFIKKCLSVMDRGFVFQLISSYLEKLSSFDVQALCEYKFEFLEIICSHEHFIPLNLPLMRGITTRGPVKNIKDFEHEYRLSEEYCRHHYLLGLLLLEVKSSFCESQSMRQTAISVLRNLMAKHAFDDRYQGKLHQARIASLYMPFVSILLENLRHQHPQPMQVLTPPSQHKQKKMCSPSQIIVKDSLDCITNTVSSLAVDLSVSVPTSARSQDSPYLSVIAGQPQPIHVTFASGSSTSINSSASHSSAFSCCDHESEKKEGGDSLRDVRIHARSQSLPFHCSSNRLNLREVQDILVCFLYVLKHVNDELLIGWWNCCSENDMLDFLQVLEMCLHQFKYMGKKKIRSQHPVLFQPKSMTLPARTPPPSFVSRCSSTYSEASAVSASSSDSDSVYRALLEANMATEVGLIALDVLGLYTLHMKDLLLQNDGDNPLMRKVFAIYLSFLQVGQSERLLKHLFASLRTFISKFPIVLFHGNAILCGKLCFELLRCCNSKLQTVRNEACALLYLLMRSNFEFTQHKEMTRMHLQLIVSVSQLLADAVNLNDARLQESLSVIISYANSDKAMHDTAFLCEVKDLIKRIRTVLMATVQMKEHENDPEMFVDLHHQLANSYASTPALRKTWLESMARIHLKNRDFSEAAYCFIHAAAVEAECLKQKGVFPEGCSAFKNISPNIERDESNLKEDAGIHDVQYSEQSFLQRLEHCVKLLEQAERYEVIAVIYKLVIPIYEKHHNYEALSQCYKTLHSAFAKVVEVNKSGKRLLGTYFRVAFFGQAYFGEEDGKEYIYKEPKVTPLPEISERLYCLFCSKFGKEYVKMIMDSNQVSAKNLDDGYAYIQVTHVVPYFDEEELKCRPTEFERNHNINRFMFETPFTSDSSKPRGSPEEQYKRRTVLTALYSFPYVKKRIPVLSKTIQVLSPIEVAIDEMKNRLCELHEAVTVQPTDLKKLQLKLQGSISVQVNAGPLAYAEAFLDESKVDKHPQEMVVCLRNTYKRFIELCQEALELNGKLITSDQYEYHSSLKFNFTQLINALAKMLNDEDQVSTTNKDSQLSKRTSRELFSYISGSSGTSTA